MTGAGPSFPPHEILDISVGGGGGGVSRSSSGGGGGGVGDILIVMYFQDLPCTHALI